MRALCLTVLIACGGKAAPAEAPKGPPPCERVADHLVGLLTADYRDRPAEERPTEAIDRMTKMMIDVCTRGGWSADAQQCFLEVRALDDAAAWDRCAGYLTVAQREELPRAIDATFGKRGQ